MVRSVANAATNAWSARGGEEFGHCEVNRGGGKVERAADVVVIEVSSHDASDISCGEAEAGELLNGCISTSQAGTYRTQRLTETPDWMGDVLPPEADVDEDQSVVELDGKYVGDAFGNAHRCEGAAVEVVDMTNRSDLWKHDRNPSFRKLT